MNITVFPCDLEAVGKLRVIYPYTQLETHLGWTVTADVAGKSKTGKLLWNLPGDPYDGVTTEQGTAMLEASDTFVLQRPLDLPYAPFAAWLKANGKRLVVDLDDWMHGIPRGNKGHDAVRDSPQHSLDTLKRVLAYTDLLTVATERLAYLYRPYTTGEIRVIPNYLRKHDWAAITPAYEKDRGIRVGWQGWLKYRGNDLKVLKKTLPKWLKSHPEVTFVNVGNQDALDYLRVPGRTVPGAVFPHHAGPVSEIDIGLVPLAHLDFNEAKSCLKGMEYAACGAPCITSNTQPYREWVDGTNGVVASSPADWVDALDCMVTDDRWRAMGRVAHAKVQWFWIEDNWPKWQAALCA